MHYVLGIDLGTSYSAAAVGTADGRVEMFQLGSGTAAIPSLVVVRADGEILVGEAAERRSLTEPGRTAREFKRRLGDPVPVILGGTPYGPDALVAILLRAIARQVAAQLDERASHVVVTHPASYGPYKLDLLRQAVRQAELGEATFVSEPVAAAIHYASLEQVPNGETIAVYDFGGGTFDATILEKTDGGFQALGTPEGLERLGGVDFDEAIFRHVVRSVAALAAVDARDPAVAAGLARLRDECRRAKEALSVDSDATILVSLPGIQTEVRLTRAEFEAMIEPRIAETVAALGRAASSADVRMVELDRILFVGGTSRIPRIAERVHAATGRPIKVDVHPKHSVAMGAARLGLAALRDVATLDEPIPAALASMSASAAVDVPTRSPAPTPSLAPTRATGPARRRWLVPALGLAAALLGGVAILASGIVGGAAAQSPGATTGGGVLVLPTAPPALPTFAPGASAAAGSLARITGVTLAGDQYVASFETIGFTPSMSGQHVHFFWDTVPPDRAGEPGGGPYVVYAGGSPFAGFGQGARPDGATAICVTVANVDHSVVPASGTCSPVP
jgi:molecular chaperone DnaK